MLSSLNTGRTWRRLLLHKLSLSFVYKIKSEVDNAESLDSIPTKCKKCDRHSNTFKTPEFVVKVQEMADNGPGKSVNTLSKELSVAYGTYILLTVWYTRIFATVPTFVSVTSSWTRPCTKGKHHEKNNLLKLLQDEFFFHDQKVNRRKDRWLCSMQEPWQQAQGLTYSFRPPSLSSGDMSRLLNSLRKV